VRVGSWGMVGEVIETTGESAVVQVFEDTTGVRPGEEVVGTGMPLAAELGPGLVGGVFDGIQRPLLRMSTTSGAFVERGVHLPPLDRSVRWAFTPHAKVGQRVAGGVILGTVQETDVVEHRVLVPPDVAGDIREIRGGEFSVEETVCVLRTDDGDAELSLMHRWPVRHKRPVGRNLPPNAPLLTGQRVLDSLFPLAMGGVGAVPGGFGTGKTMLQHALAKWAACDVVVYIGCGERGNEMTQVLREFPELVDPRTGKSLSQRTILIANTSNMPVTARESSIYTGITVAEYYRDMGYNVAVMADSTSRWAEALREIAGRMEQMPMEEGYPAYLPTRLASFYERAGRVHTLSDREGSVSIVGAVSPQGGDLSEPVAAHTKRFVKAFWALDKELAGARHFPAVGWMDSYSEYVEDLRDWWEERHELPWHEMRAETMRILRDEARLEQVVKLVGADALPERQRLSLEVARLIREAYLQQSGLDPKDAYSGPLKQLEMLRTILHFHRVAQTALDHGVPLLSLLDVEAVGEMVRMKTAYDEGSAARLADLRSRADEQVAGLVARYQR
jgi:V/A-type H+-transporting ATPase subunit A